MADTTILLGNTKPLDVTKYEVDDQSAVQAVIDQHARAKDAVEVFPVFDPSEGGEPVDTGRRVVQLTRERGDLGNQICTMSFPEDWDLVDVLTAARSMWPFQSNDLPEWVEAEDEALAESVASLFRTGDHECVVGRPEGWEEG